MSSHLEQEIASQPDVLRQLLQAEREHVDEIAAAIKTFSPAFVLIAARGTSDNAARYAQYGLGIHAHLPVALAAPSIHTLYKAPPALGRALVIGISQSGMAADVMQVVRDAREQGALTISITNNAASPLATAAEHHIDLHAGEEVSVAATKTYTAQLAVVAMLVAALSDNPELRRDLHGLPGQAAAALENSDAIRQWVEEHPVLSTFAALGRGYNYATAIEICLKIQELCYVVGQGYSEADFLHGPIAVVGQAFRVFLVAPTGVGSSQMGAVLDRILQRGAEPLVISNDPAYAARSWARLPVMPEWLSPISAIIPGQLFALHQALIMGRPIDRPVGLSKVTVTQ